MSNRMPLVTVIITNYNYGEFISDAIESVISQTYPNIELLVINDGSTDNSDEIIRALIKKYEKKNIRYISRRNRGIVYTRNEGIKLAKGDYISYLDADDYFDKDYIDNLYRVAKAHNADVVYPNWHFVGEWLGRPDTDFPEFESKLLQMQKLHVTPASLIKRSSVINRKFKVEKVAEDWDFFIGMSLEGYKFKLAKGAYLNYRIRKGTRGSKNNPKDDTKYFVEILNKHKEKYGNKVIDPKKLIRDRHPSLFIRAVRLSAPRIVAESIKNEGTKVTAKKIVKKVASKNKPLVAGMYYKRNQDYYRKAVLPHIKTSNKTKLAIIVHLYYPDSWTTIESKLKKITAPFDLFVTVKINDQNIEFNKISEHHKSTNVFALPNRGRDVLPFLVVSKILREHKQYEYILKLHSKKSLHRSDGNEWINSLLDELIPDDTSEILKTLKKENTGAIGPKSHIVSLSRYMGGNRELVGFVLQKITDEPTIEKIIYNQKKYPFFGGTMFWCRIDFLDPLTNAKITPADFNTEKGQVDNTTAHAIERVLGRALHLVTGKKMYVIDGLKVSSLPNKNYEDYYKYVD